MKIFRLCLYLLLIVLIGGLGVWISLVQHWRASNPQTIYTFIGNLGTFSISVAVMSFADFLLMAGYSSTRALLLLVWMAIAIVASAASLILQVPLMLGVAIGAAIMALVEWLFVNFSNPVFDVASNPQATLGGDPTA